MVDRKTDSPVWDDKNFIIDKWEDFSKYKLESLRRNAEAQWNRDVSIQEVADMAIDYAYKGLSLKIAERRI